VDPTDRSTAILFGDGAGAVLLRAGDAAEPGAVGPFDLGSDGTGADLITVPGGGSRARSAGAAPDDDRYLVMAGQAVYRRAISELTASSSRALAKAGWRADDVTAFVGHQANQRILDVVAGRLGIAERYRLGNIAEVGNTAAASIPIALADAAVYGRLTAGDRVLLAAFGGGLTWGATTLVWPRLEVMAELPRI
jgi:3-oxoacyl-[acyl-carrier-protein] synthase-3